jgi:hypothetical protein
VVLEFVSNDRGYAPGTYVTDAAGAQRLRDELAALVEQHATKAETFAVASAQGHFTLAREFENALLILGIIGTDPRFGTSFHRGNTEAMRQVVMEFDAILRTLADVVAGKGPAA